MTHPDTLQRAEFEAWVVSQYKPGSAQLKKDADGDYVNIYTMREWAGWKAALESRPDTLTITRAVVGKEQS